MIRTFKQKMPVLKAIQFTGENQQEIAAFSGEENHALYTSAAISQFIIKLPDGHIAIYDEDKFAQTFEPFEEPVETPSYLSTLENTLNTHKAMHTHLTLRKSMLETDIAQKKYNEAWEANEASIMLLETNNQIASLNKVIKEKYEYFVRWAKEFEVKRKETEQNFDKVYERAKRETIANIHIKRLLENANMEMAMRNTEMKVDLYFRLKKLLNL